MSHPMAAAVSATALVKTYKVRRGAAPVRALDGLSLEIAPGTVYALLGPNGAGKSTAVRILATLSRPETGAVAVAGIDALRDPDAVRHQIGLVSQKASSDPMATTRENLVLAGRVQGLSRSAAAERARELIARFDLGAVADRLAKTLSGGTARRLDVAIGLMHRPRVLFLDEPTTGLDPEARADMWAEIDRLAAQDEITVLLTTHYLEEADRLADRVGILDHGRLAVEGTPDALKRELDGDALHLELARADDVPAALVALERLGGLEDVTGDGPLVRARAERGARAVPAVVAALEEEGIEVASVTVARPSLDDVYLRHAGRSFEVAA